ncbi:MAG TPA: hypothetical protein VGO62_00980, partial [Myxococcota bacterium]
PGISQRLPDLGLLLDDFLARARGAPAISRDACRAVLKYPFHAHVRAMARVIEAAATLAGQSDAKAPGGQRGSIEIVHLPIDVVGIEMIRAMTGVAPGAAAIAANEASVPDNTSEMPALSTSARDDGFLSEDATDPLARARSLGLRANTPPHGVPNLLSAEREAQIDVDSISAAIRAAHGNVSAAARALGRPRAVVLRWLRELGIDPTKMR